MPADLDRVTVLACARWLANTSDGYWHAAALLRELLRMPPHKIEEVIGPHD